MAVLFVMFNVFSVDINICLVCSCLLSVPALRPPDAPGNLRWMFNAGATESVPMTMTVAAVCGFAGVITSTEAFQSMIDIITGIDISRYLSAGSSWRCCACSPAVPPPTTCGSAAHRAKAPGPGPCSEHDTPCVLLCRHHARFDAVLRLDTYASAHVPHEAQGGLPRPVCDNGRSYLNRHCGRSRPCAVPSARMINPLFLSHKKGSKT